VTSQSSLLRSYQLSLIGDLSSVIIGLKVTHNSSLLISVNSLIVTCFDRRNWVNSLTVRPFWDTSLWKSFETVDTYHGYRRANFPYPSEYLCVQCYAQQNWFIQILINYLCVPTTWYHVAHLFPLNMFVVMSKYFSIFLYVDDMSIAPYFVLPQDSNFISKNY
jgi:hypothetical protein